MRKIRLSDTDVELFDIEIAPTDYNFYVKHKDAFKTMWREQVTGLLVLGKGVRSAFFEVITVFYNFITSG